MSVTSHRKKTVSRTRELAAYQHGKCFFCDAPLVFSDELPEEDGSNDWVASQCHMLKKRDGGTGHQENIVITHRACCADNTIDRSQFSEKLRQLNEYRGPTFPPNPLGVTPSADALLAKIENSYNVAYYRRYAIKWVQNTRIMCDSLSGVKDTSIFREAALATFESRWRISDDARAHFKGRASKSLDYDGEIIRQLKSVCLEIIRTKSDEIECE